ASKADAELDSLEQELRDRYGAPPVEAQNLLWLIRIKQLLKRVGIDTLTVGSGKVSLIPGKVSQIDPAKVIALVATSPKKYQITPDSKLVAAMPTETLRDLFFALESLLKQVVP